MQAQARKAEFESALNESPSEKEGKFKARRNPQPLTKPPQ